MGLQKMYFKKKVNFFARIIPQIKINKKSLLVVAVILEPAKNKGKILRCRREKEKQQDYK